MKLFRYRIVANEYEGYKIQRKFILGLRWHSYTNTFKTVEEAEDYYYFAFNTRVIKELP